jgi:DNA-binding NarL/FixJ family response regulator
MKITVGIADDQLLFMKSLIVLIETFPDFEVVMESQHGEDLCRKLVASSNPPDILLLDVDMPVMDGPAAAAFISARFPLVRMIALSMKDDEMSVIKMIRAGCCAYLCKDMHPNDLEKALSEVAACGYYNSDERNSRYRKLTQEASRPQGCGLTERETEFLRLSCSDMTYRQIAAEMHLSERTIDGYRESLFEKFTVQSRVGMVLEGLRRELVRLDTGIFP